MTRTGFYEMARLVAFAWVATIIGMLIHAQAVGAPGRTTGAHNNGGTYIYSLTLGTGQVQVSCDSGSTWNTIAGGSGSVSSGITYFYPTPHCTGVTNLNTLQFREFLGGGGAAGFNMQFTTSSQVTISW